MRPICSVVLPDRLLPVEGYLMMYVDRALFFVFMLAVAFLLLIVAVIRRNFYITEIPEVESLESLESD